MMLLKAALFVLSPFICSVDGAGLKGIVKQGYEFAHHHIRALDSDSDSGSGSASGSGSKSDSGSDSGDGDSDSGDFICFSPHSSVRVMGHSHPVRLNELKIGDLVQNEFGSYEKVYSFSHKEPSQKGNYLQILAIGMDKPIEISPKHMLYVQNSDQKTNDIVAAGNVNVGDKVILKGETPAEVKSIRKVVRAGAYAPLTPSGKIVVDDVVASNYVEHEALKPYVSADVQHSMQHGAFAGYRLYCLKFGCENETYDETNEHSKGIVMWLYLLQWLEQQQTYVLLAFVCLIAIPGHKLLLLLEAVGPSSLLAAGIGYYLWKKRANQTSPSISIKKAAKAKSI